MAEPMVDQITRLKLKLLQKRLENERNKMESRAESSQSARSYDGQIDELHRALRRKRDLLHRLREQHLLDHLSRPHTWGGMHRRYQPSETLAGPPPPPPPAAPIHIYHPAPAMPTLPAPQLAPPPQPPRIIQQTLPQHPATIIQQLPQHPATIIQQLPQQPLIAQTPLYPAPRSGSIKEDMVELMLMQNAQMHQIIMHNMMLKALPPMALSPPAGGFWNSTTHSSYHGQEGYHGNPIVLRSDRPKGGGVHHHHHYGPAPLPPQLPPIGYAAWPPVAAAAASSLPGGQPWGQPAVVHLPPAHHHVTGDVTLPPLNMYGSR